jgi:hypothetical protein
MLRVIKALGHSLLKTETKNSIAVKVQIQTVVELGRG